MKPTITKVRRTYRPMALSVHPDVEKRLRKLAYESRISVSAIVAYALERLLEGKDDEQVRRLFHRQKLRPRRDLD